MIDLTPGQGSALSGLFTALGAVIGIIIAGRFFSGKVKSLSEALDESRRLLTEHADAVRITLASITEEVNVLRDAVGSVGEQAARIESNVADAEALRQPEVEGPEVAAWEQLRERWLEVRDLLEAEANSDELDGRRRAAYSRMDRRTYGSLIERMNKDGELSDEKAEKFQEALDIWLRYRNGRLQVAQVDFQRMSALLASLNAQLDQAP
ncbi:MAG: hypothetical protein KJZ64_01735 [Sphingomonadaceae bacterium]|nr:hypothetical protein [Sphingomonadaceae bacterium]